MVLSTLEIKGHSSLMLKVYFSTRNTFVSWLMFPAPYPLSRLESTYIMLYNNTIFRCLNGILDLDSEWMGRG